MLQFCSHMGSKYMQCWMTSVISKKFAMWGSMLWVVFVFQSLCSLCEVQHLISARRMPANTQLLATNCQLVSSTEVALASVAFQWPPPGRHLHTEAHTAEQEERPAFLVFLDTLKLKFLPSLRSVWSHHACCLREPLSLTSSWNKVPHVRSQREDASRGGAV